MSGGARPTDRLRAVIAVAAFAGGCLVSNANWDQDDDETAGTSGTTATTTSGSSTADATGSATTSTTAAASTGDDASTGTTAAMGPAYVRAVLEDGPVGYWRMGDTGTPMAADETGSNVGTYLGGVGQGEPGLAIADDAAARFDGDDDFVRFASLFNFDGRKPFSAELWAMPDDNDAGCLLGSLDYEEGVGYRGWFVASFEGQIRFNRTPGGNLAVMHPELGTPTHIVVTYDGFTHFIYFDGEEVGARTNENDVGVHAREFMIGDCYQWANFAGVIDEVAIYDFTLTSDQVAAHFAAATL